MKTFIQILCMNFLVAIPLKSQTESKVYFSGYVKQLQGLYFSNLQGIQNGSSLAIDNLFHHRLNMEWEINNSFRIKTAIRNRIFYGDLVKGNSGYADFIDSQVNNWLDLSMVWLNSKNFIGHSTLDRFYAEYTKKSWEISVGRQRVNWGISTIWNPNDIFNAYSFTDFDYEERPGSDVLRVRYFTGQTGSLEVAIRGANNVEDATFAGRWLFNKSKYDLQLITGFDQEYLLLGGGWAGNIKNAGFKGETTLFYHPNSRNSIASSSLNIDYVFKKGFYINVGALYNSNGKKAFNINQLFTFDLSARNLYPYRWANFVQMTYPINSILTTSLTSIYSPNKSQSLYVHPTVTFFIANNWTIDTIGQVVFEKDAGKYSSPLQAYYLRLKYSY